MELSSCSLLDSVLDKSCAFLTVSAPPEKEEKEKGAEQAKEFAAAIPAILSAVNSVLTSALSMDNRIPCMHRIFQVRNGLEPPSSHTIPLLKHPFLLKVLRRYTQSQEPHQRERSAESVLALLKKFVELKSSDPEAPEKVPPIINKVPSLISNVGCVAGKTLCPHWRRFGLHAPSMHGSRLGHQTKIY